MGDGEGYRRICAGLLKGVGQGSGSELANYMAWLCAVGPDALGDYTQVVALAEAAVSQAPRQDKHTALNTLGAVLYRAGHYRKSIVRLQEGIEAGKGDSYVQDLIFLAMAHHRLGEVAEARQLLVRAAQHQVSDQGQPWSNLEVTLLRQEATALIEGKLEAEKKE
jgi:tetratricopeptide (TPR) repeat protein